MVRQWLLGVATTLWLAGAPLATAQDEAAPAPEGVAAPAELYRDDDPAAVMPEMIGATDNRARKRLEQILEYDPQNVPARVQHGFHLIDRGLNRRAYEEFEYALRVSSEGSLTRRHAHWGYGWALFMSGEYDRALAQWQQAASLHGGNPSWVPTTIAAGLWYSGQRDRAVDYWRAAVRSDPDTWGTTRGLERAIADWPPNRKLAAQSVHAEWKRRVTEE